MKSQKASKNTLDFRLQKTKSILEGIKNRKGIKNLTCRPVHCLLRFPTIHHQLRSSPSIMLEGSKINFIKTVP